MLPTEGYENFKRLVKKIEQNPNLLHEQDHYFLKAIIERFGGIVPNNSNESNNEIEPQSKKVKREPSTKVGDVDTTVFEIPTKVANNRNLPTLLGEIDDDEAAALFNEKEEEGYWFYRKGNFERALLAFNEAIELVPGIPSLYNAQKECYLKLNKTNACILEPKSSNTTVSEFKGCDYRSLICDWRMFDLNEPGLLEFVQIVRQPDSAERSNEIMKCLRKYRRIGTAVCNERRRRLGLRRLGEQQAHN